jgi:hypothetical protein
MRILHLTLTKGLKIAMGMSVHFNMKASGFTAHKIPSFDGLRSPGVI